MFSAFRIGPKQGAACLLLDCIGQKSGCNVDHDRLLKRAKQVNSTATRSGEPAPRRAQFDPTGWRCPQNPKLGSACFVPLKKAAPPGRSDVSPAQSAPSTAPMGRTSAASGLRSFREWFQPLAKTAPRAFRDPDSPAQPKRDLRVRSTAILPASSTASRKTRETGSLILRSKRSGVKGNGHLPEHDFFYVDRAPYIFEFVERQGSRRERDDPA